MTTARHAWQNAERRVFEWLKTQLEAIEDAEAFLGELPDQFPGIDGGGKTFRVWMFKLDEESEVVAIQPSAKPGGAWRMDGEWRGLFYSRTEAQDAAGILRDKLPLRGADGGLPEGVGAINRRPGLKIQRATVELAPDAAGSKLGPVRVWEVVQPLDVVFSNSDQAEV